MPRDLALSLSVLVRTYSPRYGLHLDSASWLTLPVAQKHEHAAGRSGVVPLCKQDGCIIPGISVPTLPFYSVTHLFLRFPGLAVYVPRFINQFLLKYEMGVKFGI